MKEFKIAVIPGDGIGPEVAGAARRVLETIGEINGHSFKFSEWPAGGAALDISGIPLPPETVRACRDSDAVILGAVGGPKWDDLPGDQRPEKALLGLRHALGLYANLRPALLYEPLKAACPLHPEIAKRGIDLVFVRELTGGIYFGESGLSEDEAYDTMSYSKPEIERIGRTAFELARKRRGHLTSIDKANVLDSSRLWRSVMLSLAEEYPDVTLDHLYVDNASMQLISRPSSFDVLVAGNLFADILSDEAAMLTGSIGMLPSASLGDPGKPGLFEPIHGSAPDLAGRDLANPLAAILSVAMLLRLSCQLDKEADLLERAVNQVLQAGYRTADIAGRSGDTLEIKVGTAKMVDAVIAALTAGRGE